MPFGVTRWCRRVDDVTRRGMARAESHVPPKRRYASSKFRRPSREQSRRRHGVHDLGQVLVVDEGGQVAVPQVVGSSPASIVVDVDGDGAELMTASRSPRRDGVAGIEADVVAGPDSQRGQMVGQAIGLVLRVRRGELTVAGRSARPARGRRRRHARTGGHVQCHGVPPETRTCYCSGKAFGVDLREEIAPG